MISELRPKIIETLKQEDQFDLYENIELPLTYILADMVYTGV